MADGAEAPTREQEEAIPTMAVAPEPAHSACPCAHGRAEAANRSRRLARRKVLASPAVRQRARDLGIDLGQVKTSSDRIRHADLDAYLLYNGGSVSGRGAAPRADETIKVVGLRRKIAENMQEAKRRIPHFTLVEEFDVTALEETRAMMNRDRGDNPKLTVLPFLITAMAKALPEWPMLNATFDDDAGVITRHGSLNLGMATQTPNGLMVAVIRDAQNQERVAAGARDPAPRRRGADRQGHARGAERLVDHPVQPRPDGRRHLDPGHQPAGSGDHRRQQGRARCR